MKIKIWALLKPRQYWNDKKQLESRQKWRGGLYAETAVSSDSHIQIGGLTSAILIVLGGVSLKFQGL